MKAKEPGDLFQVDHMSVNISSGFQVKHFQGICPVTKMVVEQGLFQRNELRCKAVFRVCTNSYRPHQALQYLTPLQYFSSVSEA